VPIIAKDNFDGTYESVPLGTQQAICVFVEDIGTHESSYQGKPLRNHQIIVCWALKEIMSEGDNTGKPFMISKYYTLSLNEKANLCKDLESWRGKAFTVEEKEGFDVEKLIGANCLLGIIEAENTKGKKYAKIASISPIVSGMEKMLPIKSDVPEWITEKRKQSIEWQEQVDSNNFANEDEEGLPF